MQLKRDVYFKSNNYRNTWTPCKIITCRKKNSLINKPRRGFPWRGGENWL